MKQLAIRLGAVKHAPSRWLFGPPVFLFVSHEILLDCAENIQLEVTHAND